MLESCSVGGMVCLYLLAGMTWVSPGGCIDLTCNKDITCFATDGHLFHLLHRKGTRGEDTTWVTMPRLLLLRAKHNK